MLLIPFTVGLLYNVVNGLWCHMTTLNFGVIIRSSVFLLHVLEFESSCKIYIQLLLLSAKFKFKFQTETIYLMAVCDFKMRIITQKSKPLRRPLEWRWNQASRDMRRRPPIGGATLSLAPHALWRHNSLEGHRWKNWIYGKLHRVSNMFIQLEAVYMDAMCLCVYLCIFVLVFC